MQKSALIKRKGYLCIQYGSKLGYFRQKSTKSYTFNCKIVVKCWKKKSFSSNICVFLKKKTMSILEAYDRSFR